MPERVRDVMTSDVVTVEPTASLQSAAALMRDHNIGNVLVADDGEAVGILTDRDLVVRALAAGASPDDQVGPFVSSTLFTVGPDDAVARVAALMAERAVRRVPVLEDGSFVGIVAIGDLAEERDPESVLGEISEAPPNN